jgi:hypothetical protein
MDRAPFLEFASFSVAGLAVLTTVNFGAGGRTANDVDVGKQ